MRSANCASLVSHSASVQCHGVVLLTRSSSAPGDIHQHAQGAGEKEIQVAHCALVLSIPRLICGRGLNRFSAADLLLKIQ